MNSNNVCGKLHTNINKFINAKLIYTKKEFSRQSEQTDFMDFIPVGKNASVIISDGKSILNKLPIYVSAKV